MSGQRSLKARPKTASLDDLLGVNQALKDEIAEVKTGLMVHVTGCEERGKANSAALLDIKAAQIALGNRMFAGVVLLALTALSAAGALAMVLLSRGIKV